MNSAQKTFALIVVLGVGAYVGYPLVVGPKPDVPTGAIGTAWKAYGNDLADAYDAAAKEPLATVSDLDKYLEPKTSAARAKWLGAVAATFEPELGNGDLDKAKAAKVLGQAAKEIRRK